jgi:hypothetical protein
MRVGLGDVPPPIARLSTCKRGDLVDNLQQDGDRAVPRLVIRPDQDRGVSVVRHYPEDKGPRARTDRERGPLSPRP